MRILIGALGVWLSLISSSDASALELQVGQSFSNLAVGLEYATESEVTNPDDASQLDFRKNQRDSFNLGLISDPIWFKLQLNNTSNQSGSWLLSLNKSYVEEFEIHALRHDGWQPVYDYSQQGTASLRQFRSITFPIKLAPEEKKRFLLRYKAPNSAVNFSLETEQDYFQRQQLDLVLIAGIFAGLVTIVIFTITPLAVIGWQLFLLYAISQLCLFLFVIHLTGFTTAYFWPETPEIGRTFATQTKVLYDIMMIQFARLFFDIKERSAWLDKALQAFLAVGVFYILMNVLLAGNVALDRNLTTIPAIIVGVGMWFTLPVVSIYATIAWDRIYLPIAVAWTMISLFMATLLLVLTGALENGVLNNLSYGLLVYVEAGCLAFAMMLRVNKIKNENLAMQIDTGNRLRSEVTALKEAADKGKLLLSTGHDARHIIGAIRAQAYLLAGGADPQKLNPGQQVDQLAQDLDDLLSTAIEGAEVSGNQSTLALGSVQIERILDTIKLTYQHQAHSKGLDFRVRSNGGTVLADRALLLRIIGNLVSNAIRFTNTGGILLAARRRGSKLAIQVWDTGIGMTDSQLHEIMSFDGQYRADESISGSGLGLNSARFLAQLSQHKLQCRSRPGQGSMFELLIDTNQCYPHEILHLDDNADDVEGLKHRALLCEGAVVLNQHFGGLNQGEAFAKVLRQGNQAAKIIILTFDRSSDSRARLSSLCDAIGYLPLNEQEINGLAVPLVD